MGYVDDERYAAALAEHRLARGWGPLRIEHDLTSSGVPEAVVNAAVGGTRPRCRPRGRAARDGRPRRAPPPPAGSRRAGFDEDVAEQLLDGS